MPVPSVWLVESLREGMGGLNHVERQASFEAEAPSVRSTVVGGCRVVIVAGERRIRSRGARSEPRNNFW
jgi:hypothetical protein